MGLFDLLKGRRSRESAIAPERAAEVQQPGESEPVGQMFPAEASAEPVAQLDIGQIFSLVTESLKSGSPQVVIGDAHAIQAHGTEMGEQIREVMAQHGISENVQPGEETQVTDPEELQRQIIDVLSHNGITLPGTDSA